MFLFLTGMVLLAAGYFFYGRLVEKILSPDDRKTPAIEMADGVDYVVLPHWKNMLIQLLNIAGVGPVIGVILGIKFGEIVFLVIPFGNMIAGATHDFLSGMMSLRNGGANLPAIIKDNLGKGYYRFFSVFSVFLLLLVVAVFINIPANLLSSLVCENSDLFWYMVIAIFAYYIAATLFSVDKIIGKIYPLFGAMLILGTAAIFATLMWNAIENPSLLSESAAFKERMFTAENGNPVLPVLFVTIACGIISGFHATQSPIVARTMKSERQARQSFYGMMIVEGYIAMIWAGAAMAIYNICPDYMLIKADTVLGKITEYFLGTNVGTITILSVVILSITSGDTAMRSVRLSLAEMLKLNQKPLFNRVLLCIPAVVVVALLLLWSNQNAQTFKHLWNYFAWGNQVLAASTLMAATAWLIRSGKNFYIAIVPAMFMTFIVSCYIIWVSPEHKGPYGLGLDLNLSYIIAAVFTLAVSYAVMRRAKKAPKILDK